MNTIQTEVSQGVMVPEPAWITPIRKDKYGGVPGLEDEELERQVYIEQFAPIWKLPKSKKRAMKPSTGEDGQVDWGAFGTIDFDRYRSEFDTTRYKVDKLHEQLKDILIMLAIVSDRIASPAKRQVLKYLHRGIIELEHIDNDDMLWLARYYLRAKRLRQQITALQEASRLRKAKRLQAWPDSLES